MGGGDGGKEEGLRKVMCFVSLSDLCVDVCYCFACVFIEAQCFL